MTRMMEYCSFGVFLTILSLGFSQQICNKVCDGDPSGKLSNTREVTTVSIFGRQIAIFVSDSDNGAFARISNGSPNDVVWIDRSWNGGRTWDQGSRIGNTLIPANAKSADTPAFNIDGNLQNLQIGALRACGKAGDRTEIVCTHWIRGTTHSANSAQAAATALMMDYNAKGQWDTTGWWNSANCLTAIIDYIKVTGDKTYQYAIDNTFEKNKNEFQGNFRNQFLDDTAWWGLAWIGAYDLTGNVKYLNTAKVTADFIHSYTDNTCGGGVWWSNDRNYKNAITNELFIKLTAAIYGRSKGETQYLTWATQVLQWFENSSMINKNNLINDGLNDNCQNNNGITWTYNQGVILGAYVELYKATGDQSYLSSARKLADSAIGSGYINPNGILHEPCDHDGIDCGGDATSFKGVFARNIGELNEALSGKPYTNYIKTNAETIAKHGNQLGQYGLHYEGPFEFHGAATQHSAFEMLTAARR